MIIKQPTITISEFMELVPDAPTRRNCACRFEKFTAWAAAPRRFPRCVAAIGTLCDKSRPASLETVPFPGKNYWDPDYPIELEYYPQTDSEVFACKKCQSVFISYMEISGHSPERRLRWVRPEIVSFSE